MLPPPIVPREQQQQKILLMQLQLQVTGAAINLQVLLLACSLHHTVQYENGLRAGYWELESDMPLLGRTTEPEPTVNSFDAVVEMTRIADGTFLHSHTFSDFSQSAILFADGNTTTINGTMTVVDAVVLQKTCLYTLRCRTT